MNDVSCTGTSKYPRQVTQPEVGVLCYLIGQVKPLVDSMGSYRRWWLLDL